MSMKSKCCGAGTVIYSSGEGTHHYECLQCKQACDRIPNVVTKEQLIAISEGKELAEVEKIPVKLTEVEELRARIKQLEHDLNNEKNTVSTLKMIAKLEGR